MVWVGDLSFTSLKYPFELSTQKINKRNKLVFEIYLRATPVIGSGGAHHFLGDRDKTLAPVCKSCQCTAVFCELLNWL
jgi:hypothetical protein